MEAPVRRVPRVAGQGTRCAVSSLRRRARLSPVRRRQAAIRAVAELAQYCTVAIVSGRDVDVVRRLVELESVYDAGSHGFDIRGPRGWSHRLEKGAEFLPSIDAAERQPRERLADIDGHAVERKRFSIAVHYGRAAAEDIARVEAIVDDVLAEQRGLQKGHGKKVFRSQPVMEWDKGHAVRWLLEQLNLDRPDLRPIYVGDEPEGIHAGAMAGTVDLIQRCYLGIDIRANVLHFDPALPVSLGRVRARLRYRRQTLDVEVNHDALRISSLPQPAAPITMAYRGRFRDVTPGDTYESRLPKPEERDCHENRRDGSSTRVAQSRHNDSDVP